MKRAAALLLALILLGGVSALRAQSNPNDKYLSTADVEKAGKLTGIKNVPYDPSKGAGGNLNFGLADGTVVLIATFQMLDAKGYATYKTQMKSQTRGAVAGIGEEAFDGPPGDYPFFIFFKKGNWVVSISTFYNPAQYGKTFLTMEQLGELCKTVASRL